MTMMLECSGKGGGVVSMTFEELAEKLERTSRTTTDKGTKFEEVIAAYLRTAPEYADQFDEVYLWQDWPERGKQHDHGIDIVARDVDTGGWCAVQCKFFDRHHHVNKADIDSFLAASGKKHFTRRMIFSTGAWGPHAEKQLDGQQIPVVRISYTDLANTTID